MFDPDAIERIRACRHPAINLLPVTIELVQARASVGEIVARLRNIWGSDVERPLF